jgi:hypothetical protein
MQYITGNMKEKRKKSGSERVWANYLNVVF